ncbi:MAG: succinylglutamate desuccinylase/aspartoacylase family protein [Erythrobacter sp.]
MAAAPRSGAREGTFAIGDQAVAVGSMATVQLPISRLSTHTEINLPVRVLHGKRPGPTLFVSAGVHGDEIIGVEIIRRLLGKVRPSALAGTLICIPVVNVFGFIQHQRYLPDRRDLNRSFPGAASGSLASQLAYVFNKEIIERSDYGIDIHSAAIHRTNLPQIRISDGRPKAEELALAFAPPAIITSPLRPGSLRSTAMDAGTDVLLFEAGEGLRFDEFAIRVGVKGVLRVMSHLGMRTRSSSLNSKAAPVRSSKSSWARAPEGGIFRAQKKIGDLVFTDDVLGVVSDPFGDVDIPVRAQRDGVIIGAAKLPIVNMGDALMHVAEVRTVETAEERLNQFEVDAFSDPMLDEDEVI